MLADVVTLGPVAELAGVLATLGIGVLASLLAPGDADGGDRPASPVPEDASVSRA